MDLADNLLPSWSEAARLAQELPELASLDLSLNLMAWPPAKPAPDAVTPFMRLETLVLNQCCLSWQDVRTKALLWRTMRQLSHLCICSQKTLPRNKHATVTPWDSMLGPALVRITYISASNHSATVLSSPDLMALNFSCGLNACLEFYCRSAGWSHGCLP